MPPRIRVDLMDRCGIPEGDPDESNYCFPLLRQMDRHHFSVNEIKRCDWCARHDSGRPRSERLAEWYRCQFCFGNIDPNREFEDLTPLENLYLRRNRRQKHSLLQAATDWYREGRLPNGEIDADRVQYLGAVAEAICSRA